MKILLVNANHETIPDPVPPLGLAYIGAALEEDQHECRVWDATWENDPAKSLSRAVSEFAPRLIGISLRNVDNAAYPSVTSYLPQYQSLVQICRQIAPQTPIVLGGSAFSLFPEEFLAKLDANYGIVGEGEAIVRKLAWSLEKSKRPCPNLNPGQFGNPKIYYPSGEAIQWDNRTPARHLFNMMSYFQQGGSLNIQTKRGCALQCAYCTYPFLEGCASRQRQPAQIADELELCLNKYKSDFFFLVDNIFNLPTDHAIAVCQEIIKRKLPIRWTAYATPYKMTEAMISLFRESGCSSLDFGTDAASPEMLLAMGKAFTVQDIEQCSHWCQQYGIKFNHSLILGYPGETQATLEQTIANILSYRPTSVVVSIGVRVYPHTLLARQLVNAGHLPEDRIGIAPVFYIEDAIRGLLITRMRELSSQYRNWIVPGLKTNINERFFKRLRNRGVKGPLWEALGN